MPGAWAPSMTVSIPRSFRRPTIWSTGKTSPVGLVTWSSSTSRVRGVTLPSTASVTCAGPAMGQGTAATTTFAPCLSCQRRALRQALYAWSVVSSSSPGCKSSERMTVFTPVVAFGTKARSSGSAPMNSASTARASSSKPSSSRARNCSGCRSIRARSSACASSTGRGQAPKEPWLRKSIRGSRVQWRARSPTLRLGRELLHERDLREAEPDAQRPQRLPGRFPRPLLQQLVGDLFRLERVARPLEELRGLPRVQVRADDLDLGGPQLDLRLDPRQDHLHAPSGHAQRIGVELAQVEPEVRDGKHDRSSARRPHRVARPLRERGPDRGLLARVGGEIDLLVERD